MASPARELVQALTLAYHRLTRAADDLHEGAGVTTGLRSILMQLASGGPATVSMLARTRGVSRQFVQRLADVLVAKGWVVAKPNPHHRRSPLLTLSASGAARVEAIREAEEPYWRDLQSRLNPEDVAATLRVLELLTLSSESPP